MYKHKHTYSFWRHLNTTMHQNISLWSAFGAIAALLGTIWTTSSNMQNGIFEWFGIIIMWFECLHGAKACLFGLISTQLEGVADSWRYGYILKLSWCHFARFKVSGIILAWRSLLQLLKNKKHRKTFENVNFEICRHAATKIFSSTCPQTPSPQAYSRINNVMSKLGWRAPIENLPN